MLTIYKHPEADFWLYNIPYPVTYLIQLLFCAGGLLALPPSSAPCRASLQNNMSFASLAV